ncbi:hypothetical protein [Brochothrix thermosphacta]|uniref:hypothetical protein n=1 Tax=Brochothrix thermosphacta TaxID=2756 RepID=UPI0003E874EF|nr:hypothetical protein [Brochothrix thermosphacta]SLM94224.1 hypothetical protein FM106_07720 [Brachybacterium faecium]ANZ94216.1 hypothetical protein BFC19_01595 [Brochothrix thermosphacta]EUJ37697.1 hypothetical protein BTHER_04004 [Brochothrix thermosphacta DSM 20171 = FSL F6-1036]ODJ48818.1 hypothetical protein BFR34_08065 [Brochothrix thermosphacta DSM 20171 = FSL F6-1036]ODJ53689.1 hypothetical protein BFR40_03485 [Brochothrix thermosphacta]
MKDVSLVCLIALFVTITGETFFTLPSDNPQRLLFLLGSLLSQSLFIQLLQQLLIKSERSAFLAEM